MADDILDEHEQSERVRNWMRNNFGSILLGIAGGIAAIWGAGKFQDWRQDSRDRAGQQYSQYLAAVEKKDAAEIKNLGADLRSKYADSPYAVLSALSEAETLLAAGGKSEEALASLQWAHDNAKLAELKDLAGLRLARAQIDAGKFDQALSVVNSIKSPGFTAPAAEVRGDVLIAQSKPADARLAYEQALTEMDVASARYRFVEMKRDDIAGTSAPTAVAVAAPAKAGG